jgi:hypothetical protein
MEDWKKVMLSDENHFEIRFANCRGLCRRPLNSDRFDPGSPRRLPKPAQYYRTASAGRRSRLDFLDKGR